MCLNTWFSNGSTALEGWESFRRWGFSGEGRSALQPVSPLCSLLLTVGTVWPAASHPCHRAFSVMMDCAVQLSIRINLPWRCFLSNIWSQLWEKKSLYSRCYLKDTGKQTKISQERPWCHVFSMGCYDWQQGLEMSVWYVLRVSGCWRHMLPSTGKTVSLIYTWS